MNELINEIGFIAVGQAGGNLGNQFESKGHTILYINTSRKDLDTLSDAKNKFQIPGADGAAQDRNNAQDSVIDNWDTLNIRIDEVIKEKIIFVIFSAAGGTGSGASPMLMERMIQDNPGRRIGAIAILPGVNEPPQAQANAWSCLQELKKLDDTGPIFIVDNNTRKDKFTLNDEFVELFESFLRLPEIADKRGVTDSADLKRALDCCGCAVLAKLQQNQNSTAELLNSLENNIFAPMENDGVIEYILLSMSSYIEMEEFKSKVGEPMAIFLGYNQQQTVCLLSGLSFPDTRLDGMEKLAIEVNERRKKARVQKQEKLTEDKSLDIDLGTAKKQKTKLSKEELFAKYRKKKS